MSESQSDLDKIKSYTKELEKMRNMAVMGKAWEDIEPIFNNFNDRINSENEAVQLGVALNGQSIAETGISLYGKMPKFAFNLVASKMEKSMPTDLTNTKKSMDDVSKALGKQISPRVAFYYKAVRQLPDNDPGNPKAMLKAMRDAYKIKK